MQWDPPPCIIRPKERDVRPRWNMGHLSGQNPIEGTARGDRALLPHGGAALWGHVNYGRGWVCQSPRVKPFVGAAPVPT